MKDNIMYRLLIFFVLCNSMYVKANVRLPGIIGSNMVIQQQSKVKLWGWADPYEKVSVTSSWDNQTYSTVGSRDAKWQIDIETPRSGGPYTISIKGNNTLLLTNVLVGEVWLCSGQSNMEMSGNWGLQDIKDELKLAQNTSIRFFHIPKGTADCPQDDVHGHWEVCDSSTLKSFSAVGYFFGKKINAKLGVPVGLINASWGGTAAEVWTPDSVVNNNPVLKEAARIIQPSGMCPYIPGHAYNAMIAPLIRFAIAGTIWYQGENNTEAASTYQLLFTSLIEAWRLKWKQDFPFYYVQIAPFRYKKVNTGALLREAQSKSAACPNTGMVVITDLVNDVNNVHPQDKHDVGYRLANFALADHYKMPGIPCKSPGYGSMRIKKNKVIITINDAPNGLKTNGGDVKELYVAGADSVFHQARASFHDTEMEVWSKNVPHPVAVRYAFSDTAIGNIFNKESLPLAPFRTDNWPVRTW